MPPGQLYTIVGRPTDIASSVTREKLSEREVNQLNMLALAHVGDAVYELLVRSMLCRERKTGVMQLHRLTVEQVCAEAQAEAVI